MTPGRVRQDINTLIRHLQSVGLVDDYQEAIERQSKFTEISFSNSEHVTSALKNIDYAEIYSMFSRYRVFNARLFDGAFIQMMYKFEKNKLLRHRLAFLPPPSSSLDELDLESEYIEFGETNFFKENRLGRPIRFDFNSDSEVHIEVIHPKCHLTVGNYAYCRIPVSAALTPYWFLYFILQNFYSTKNRDFRNTLPRLTGHFPASIVQAEKRVPYLVVPR